MTYFQKNRAGFTIIELIVVVAIISLLTSVVIASLQSAKTKSQNAARLSGVDQIDKALQLYLTKTNSLLPSTGGVWQCIGLTSGTCWAAPYSPATTLNTALTGNISSIPKDPAIPAGTNGDYFIYNSAFTGTSGTGSYVSWMVNDLGNGSCGRGYIYGGPAAGFYQCMLFLGKD